MVLFLKICVAITLLACAIILPIWIGGVVVTNILDYLRERKQKKLNRSINYYNMTQEELEHYMKDRNNRD